MKTELLDKAMEDMRAHPEVFSMSCWECGTWCCIGGFIGRAADDKMQNNIGLADEDATDMSLKNVSKVATLLQLEFKEAYALTILSYWPNEFREDYQYVMHTKEEKVEIACKRIEHFKLTRK